MMEGGWQPFMGHVYGVRLLGDVEYRYVGLTTKTLVRRKFACCARRVIGSSTSTMAGVAIMAIGGQPNRGRRPPNDRAVAEIRAISAVLIIHDGGRRTRTSRKLCGLSSGRA